MTKLTKEQVEQLEAPLNGDYVAARKQSGITLSYIEGYHAINEANRIFGFDGWSLETISNNLIEEADVEIGQKKTPGVMVGYAATVRVTVGDVTRTQTGYGSSRAVNPVDAHELAMKEAETDAMKRALRTFGNQFGNALYDKEQKEVDYGDTKTTARKKTTTKTSSTKKTTKTSAKTTPSKSQDEFKEMIDNLTTEEEFINFRKEYQSDIKSLGEEGKEVIKYYTEKRKEAA